MNEGEGLRSTEADRLRPGAGKSTASFQDQVFVCQCARMVSCAKTAVEGQKREDE